MNLKFNGIELEITREKVINYLFAKYNSLLSQLTKQVLGSSWRDDQANWRLEQVTKFSPVCIEKGFCIQCGCEWADKKHYEQEPCDKKCYPRWLTRHEWEVLQTLKDETQRLEFINLITINDNE
jgi:hypothetical protein